MIDPSANVARHLRAPVDKQAPMSAERRRLLELRLKGSAAAHPKSRRIRSQHPPLSAGQHQMWVIEQMIPGNPAYHIPVAWRIAGDLDVSALEESFNQIIQRHESWRTTIRDIDGNPVQQIHPECKIQISVTDLSHLPSEESERQSRELAAGEAVRPFDLRQLPLLRVSLFRLGRNDHVLLVNVHHIVADGLSLRLMFDELDAIYRALTSGTMARLPVLTAQYADFAAWQDEKLSDGRHSQQLDYWQQQLKGELPVLELATDKPRPLRQSFNGSNVNFTISRTLAQALTALGNQERCTFFVTVFAAFQVLLMRHSGCGEVLIGTPVASRPLPEFERLIGNFLNVVALRCDPTGNPAFIELMRRCRDTTLLALSNTDVPFETVVKSLKSHRDPSRNPVFQVLMQVLPPVHGRIGESQDSRFDFEMRFSQVDLALHLFEEPDGGFFGQMQFSTDLFAPETIERLALNFVHLLNEIVRDPFQKILEIPVIATAEKNRLLHEWNQTTVAFPGGMTLHALIEQQAGRTPDSVAVQFEDRQLTYRELDQHANQLANRLRSLGVGPNVLVGISIERSLDLVIGLLGILKAGGAYVPIDPDYPGERRAFMLEDAAVPVLLTQQKLVAGLPPHNARVICLDTDWESVAGESDHAPTDIATEADLAYMIYTSGSTGRPKGALNRHRGIVNRLLWMQNRYQLTPSDAVLQKTPFSFDVSVWEFFWPLMTGARLVVARPGGHQDPAYLIRLIAERQITVTHFVPPMLRVFLDQPEVSSCASLRHVICSGEALPHDLQEKFFTRLPCQLHNLYGPTEAAVDVTHWTCQRGSKSTVVPIGRPVANTRCYILDALLQPVPIGVPGELHIGGVQVGRGYHNRPELTAEKFIADPFSSEPGARLYKTGDLCRYLPDGNIDYLGRMDHQVKVRGFRIELGEIEATLKQHPSIQDTVVVAREGAPGDKRLVAYVVSALTPCPVADLRNHLKTCLPDYMVPGVFVFLDSLPLSANGKVDRKALPIPELNRGVADEAFAAPQTEIELKVSLAWKQILKVDRVGLHDNFFDLGGDSLAAMQVISRLRGPQFPDLNVFQIFERPTVADFARALPVTSGDAPREEGVL